jgi:uncharacterized membrane protein YkvA (DUF1232 family)
MSALGTIGRTLGWVSFVPLASRAPDYGRLLWALARDERIPTASKALLAGAAGYTIVPLDVIPDWVPIIGRLDDAVVVVLAIDLFLESVPKSVLDEKIDELKIDREGLERDLAQLRRLVPRPVRRAARQLPRAARAVESMVERSGVIPATRRWVNAAAADARGRAADARGKAAERRARAADRRGQAPVS